MEQSDSPVEPKPVLPEDASAPPPSEGTATDEESLPEWEELSPELLEDEAIRGDFVLRWAVVGLALLFGCSQLSDARPLVHVRSGDWLIAHGVLPSGTDPFSLAGAERRWVNLSWLFDLFAAGVHAVSGPLGLSIAQGLLAAVAFALLSHAVRSRIRTWWGSVCAVMALLAAFPQLNITPEIVTLCGVAGCLWWLVRCEERGSAANWWGFVPGLWLWAQLDPRAWIGGGMLLVYWLGELLARREPGTARVVLWKPLLAAVAVMAVHPFLWETWLSPVAQYGVEYPALRAAYPRPTVFDWNWYPLWSPLFWNRLDFRLGAGLFLATAAAVALWLDRSRVTWSHGLLFLGANVLAVLAWREFPVAALVNCALATIHAQGWFLARFGQVYSVAWPEVLFSRGGRAVTVLSLFALAWLVVSGRLDGPDGRRCGVGLDRQLQAELDSFRQLSTADERGFHMTLRQGDALIAAGRKSFVDHRVRLFAGEGDEDLLALHNLTRRSVRRPRQDDPFPVDPSAWRDTFTNYKLSYIMPRLTLGVSGPDYDSLLDLLSNPEWTLTGMHPATAVLHWTRSPQPEVRDYVKSHPYSVMDLAFRKPEPTSDRPRERALPPTWSQQLFALPRRQPSGQTLLARHWLRLATAGQGAPLPFSMACVTLATRAAQAGVEATPDVPAAHAMLAEAYSLMLEIESASLASTGVTWNVSLRYFQAVAAAREAIRLDPDDTVNHLLLLELYRGANRIDAAYGLTQYLVQHSQLGDDVDEAELRRREELLTMDDELGKATRQLQELADKQLADGGDRLQVATALYQNGAIQHAAKLLQDDAVYVERTPSARLLLTMLLAELGAGVELDDSAVRLEAVGAADNLPRWRDAAAIAALSRGDSAVAAQHWHREVDTRDRDGVQGLLYTAALNTSSFVWLGDLGYPISHLGLVGEATVRRPQEQVLGEFNQAVCELERAHTTEATAALRRALDGAPTSPLRPLLRTYWYCLTGEALDFEPPTEWIPISADMFAAEK